MAKWLSDAQKSFKVEINRNSFDTSKTRNASYNFGYLYPMFCIPVSPNESYKIKTSGGFDLKPTIGVPQTHVKCNTAWFYVRDRQVWTNAKKFLMQDKSKTTSSYAHPLINTNDSSAFSKGSLLNHLGVPVHTVGVYNGNAVVSVVSSDMESIDAPGFNGTFLNIPRQTVSMSRSFAYAFYRRSFDSWLADPNGDMYCHMTRLCPFTDSGGGGAPVVLSNLLNVDTSSSGSTYNAVIFPVPMTKRISSISPSFLFHHINGSVEGTTATQPGISNKSMFLSFYVHYGDDYVWKDTIEFKGSNSTSTTAHGSISIKSTSVISKVVYPTDGNPLKIQTLDLVLTPDASAVQRIQSLQDQYGSLICVLSWLYYNQLGLPSIYAGNSTYVQSDDETKSDYYNVIPGFFNGFSYKSDVLVNSDVSSPFFGLGDNAKEHLSALPVRAYEAIYNSHFRDRILDPFMVDGEVAIDQYNINLGDGLDSTTPLVLQKVRYESDYFTTCVPSPQGNMFHQPLVGITVAANPDANSAVATYSEDGSTYNVEFQTDGDGKMIGMNFNSEDADRLTILTLQDAIQYGISLQDLQDKRALSKWYEATYRRGRFSYDEFIGAHYGKVPTRDEMHAPEYLGGDSLPLSMMRVLNNSLAGGALGASGGLGSFATRRNDPGEVECYCDEDGFIIGVCWFSVTPTYGQAISKFWYRKMPFDYATPEFADLGTMPVLNKELCPLQCNWDDATAVNYANGTFGYQRQYGDKLQSFDDVAGDYSDELSNLILFRRFDSVPSLGVDFVTQDPADLNNVFVLDDEKDKIYGQWHFDVVCKTWLQNAPNAQIF